MDDNTVIELSTLAQAETLQSEIHDARIDILSADGYPIILGEIVGKNALTGLPDYSAQRTTCWDVPKDTGKDTFFIQNPPAELNVTPAGEEGKDYQVVSADPTWPVADQISTSDRFEKGFE